jgi:hypothetical protein
MKRLLPLTEKYEALAAHVHQVPFCQYSLGRSLLAVEADDEDEFKAWKEDIFKTIRELWENLDAVEILKG